MGQTKPKAVRDPERTRGRILAAAAEIFAENGYAGATVEAITRVADVNMRMIYHYFGDKAGLYVAVLEDLLGGLREAELRPISSESSGLGGLLDMFDVIYRHFGDNPRLVRILSTENIMSAHFLRTSVATPEIASPSLRNIEALLARGRQDGTVRRTVDPLHLYVAMVGLAFFHRSNGHSLSHIWSTDVFADDWQDAHREVGREMLCAFLATGGDGEQH